MSGEIEQFVQKLKVTELREELKKRGLSYAGVKAKLAERLQGAMEAEAEGEADNHAPEEEEEVEEEEEGGTATEETEDSEVDIEEDEPVNEATEAAPAGEEEEEEEEEEELEVTKESDDLTADEPPATEEPNIESVPSPEEPSDQVPPEEPVSAPDTEQVSDEIPASEEEPAEEEEEEEEEPTPVEGTGPAGETAEEESMECNATSSAVEKEQEQESEGRDGMEAPAKGGEGGSEEKQEDMESSDDRRLKRVREEPEDSESYEKHSRREDESSKVDPRDVPDPESVASWSDESIKGICSNLFVLPEENKSVTLNPYKSDLHFIISVDGLGGSPLTEGGFAYLRASSKATWGVKSGSYYFECKIEEKLPVTIEEEEENGGGGGAEGEVPRKVESSHNLRVGWSSLDSETIAGDDRASFAYDSSGKKVTRSNTEEYGESFDEGDVIGCYLKLTEESKTITFTKNGVSQNEAFNLTELGVSESSFFPHVSSRNYHISFNFGGNPEPHYPPPDETYRPLQEAGEEERECVPVTTTPKGECEVIMMVGLPGCGKTFWINRHLSRNPDKDVRVIGPYQILERMLSKKRRTMTNWKEFVSMTAPMVNTLCMLAANLPCHYIIDQVNVYADSQKSKMSYFEGFVRKALVVIPPHHELRKRRVDRIRDGGCMEVPQDVMDAFKANFHIPRQEDGVFDEINYSEIYGPASDKIVRQYKDDALGLPTPYIPSKRPRYESKGRSYSSPRSKPSPYGYGAYGSSSRYYPPPSRGYYAPPPPPPHYRSYYAPPPPPSSGWAHMRGRYGHPPPPPPNPRYGGPRPYYTNRGSGGYYNRY